jgi:hypothetical protein
MKAAPIAWTFSIIYVGPGTAWIFTSFGTDKWFIDWPAFVLITLPITFVSFTIRYMTQGASYIIPVIIIQLLMLWSTYK